MHNGGAILLGLGGLILGIWISSLFVWTKEAKMPDQGDTYYSGDKVIDLNAVLKPLSEPEWEQWAFGDENEPSGLAFVRYWDRHADVAMVDPEPRVFAWRAVLIGEDAGPLVPEFVSWFFIGGLEEPVKQLMILPAPGADGAPERRMPAPTSLRVPPDWWNSGSRVIRPAAKKRPEVHGGGARKGEAPRA